MHRKVIFLVLIFSLFNSVLFAEDGYQLWLRYTSIQNKSLLDFYKKTGEQIYMPGDSKTVDAITYELGVALKGLLRQEPLFVSEMPRQSCIVIAKPHIIAPWLTSDENELMKTLGPEGFALLLKPDKKGTKILVTAQSDLGLLYGTFRLLQYMQQEKQPDELQLFTSPKIKHRLLNHWDNLDRTVERGYAGFSIWDWHKWPDYMDPRYTDYARANASIGINGAVITNVNANALVLTSAYLEKLSALAQTLRPYGIKTYLTARFSAPIEIGGLKTADPLDAQVQQWWKDKADEIYQWIPDFGGFLVKANSEGQPGPQDYGRTHAQGANMLADALAPHQGIVMWRAFVYSHEAPDDRAKQAYNEFVPLDGKFRKNVILQVKNGAIDFQPREPFHPLFGAMQNTPIMMEFQVTQEYTGCATHLFYQAPLYKETLESDTYCKGKGSTVAKVIDGSSYKNTLTGMAGVANIGTDRNWCGHPFAQANWYALGRLAWNHELSSEQIAEEWLKMTFNVNESFVQQATKLMIESRENLVNYMTPLGLHHIMARNHHYGPGPWVTGGRADWTSLYYHRADSLGIGFDRSSTGSNAVSQYAPEVCQLFDNPETCPEKYILWFHHINWNKPLKSGQILWDALCSHYYDGAESVVAMQQSWQELKPYVDKERFVHVESLLNIQAKEAAWWRDACVLYFQQFSQMPIPSKFKQPEKTLDYFQSINHRFVPGIKNE